MSTAFDERRWHERSNKLEKERNNRHRKKIVDKTDRGDVLKKAQALDRTRNSETKSPISKYEVVPPVKPKQHAYERSSADDSWGEGSDDTDDDYYITPRKPPRRNQQAYPLPPMNFALVPVQHPGYLAPSKSHDRKPKKKDYHKRKSKPSRPVEARRVSHETQTEDDLPEAPTRSQYYSPAQRYRQPVVRDPRYPYIHTTPSNRHSSYSDSMLKEATHKFYEDPKFAENIVNDFVYSQLQDQIIPDMFIEVLSDIPRQNHSTTEPTLNQNQLDRNRYRPFQLYPHSREPVEAASQVQSLVSQADISKGIADALVEEYLRSQVAAVVRETCAEYVQSVLKKSQPDDLLDNLTDKLISETCSSMLEEIKAEVALENFVEEHIIEPVVGDLTIDIAAETLEQQDNLEKVDGYKELSENAQTKFLDGILLENILEQIVRQERVHVNESPLSQFAVDEMALEILLQKTVEMDYSLSEPMQMKPVKRYHEQVTTDVVMDLLLNELCLSLDDDMQDFDEFEMGLSDYLQDNGHYEQ